MYAIGAGFTEEFDGTILLLLSWDCAIFPLMNLPTGNAYLDRTEQKIQRLTVRMLSTVGTERFRLQKQIRKLKERRVGHQLARARFGKPREIVGPPGRPWPGLPERGTVFSGLVPM